MVLRQKITQIGIITWKDIVDAFRNRLVLSLLITALIMLSFPRVFPFIFAQPEYSLVILDPVGTVFSNKLSELSDLHLQVVSDRDQLYINIINFGLDPIVGLEVSENVDQLLEKNQGVTLSGYLYWANRYRAERLQTRYSQYLSKQFGQEIFVTFSGGYIHVQETIFESGIFSINIIIILLVFGIAIVPQLIFEEKQTKTIQALLVSPVSKGQIIFAKVLTGFFYIFLIALVVVGLYWTMIVHWWVFGLFILSCGLFSVSVGLLLGCFFENQQEINGLVGIIFLMVFGALLIDFLPFEIPKMIRLILNYFPSINMSNLYIQMLVGESNPAIVWKNFGVILFVSTLLYLTTYLKTKQLDR